MVGFEKAFGAVKVIKDRIQYSSQSLLKLARDNFRLNLSANCGGMCLNWVCRHPSQLFVPEVPTTVPPKLQPYWLKI